MMRSCLISAGMAVAVACCVLSGCEESTTTGVLIVTPSELTLNSASNTATFVASVDTNEVGGQFSDTTLEWSMKEPTLGYFESTAGNQALYVSRGIVGRNFIYVKDAYDREGWAVVYQE